MTDDANTDDLTALIESLAIRMEAASDEDRLVLHAELHALIARHEALGHAVPAQLSALDDALYQEEADDSFDNLPV